MNTFKYFFLSIFFFTSLLGIANENYQDATYKISIEASPLIKELAGSELPGEAHVRLTIFGKEGSVLGGKLCESIIPTITFEREYIGRVTGVEIQLNGSRWTKPVKIDRVTIRVSGEDIDPQTFRADVGYSLTRGNSTIYIDQGGAAEFEEDVAAVQAEEMSRLAKIMGDFKDGDVRNGNFTISKNLGPTSKKTVPNTQKSTNSPEGWECTVEKVVAKQSFDENFITNPIAQSLYPGALIYAENIMSGKYITLPFARKPITLSTNIAIVDGDPIVKVNNPNEPSRVQQALNQMLIHQTKGGAQIKAQFEVTEVYSNEQLAIALGGSVSYGPGSLSFDFDYNKEQEKTTIVAKFSQEYYQVNMDPFVDPLQDVFVNTPDAEEVLNSGNTALYVGSVQYGRLMYFTLTTSRTLEEVSATLNAAYNGVSVQAEGSIALNMNELIEESNMHVMVIGGSTKDGFEGVEGYEGFKNMIQFDTGPAADELGQPIAYTLRFLSDNSIARTNLVTEYYKRNCKKLEVVEETKHTYELALIKMECLENGEGGNGLEMRNHVMGRLTYNDNLVGGTLTQAMDFNEGTMMKNSVRSFPIALGKKTFELDRADYENLNYLKLVITASLADDDGLETDNVGKNEISIPFRDIMNNQKLPENSYFDVHMDDGESKFRIWYSFRNMDLEMGDVPN